MVSEILGTRISTLRKQLNLFQHDLADKLGVSKSLIAMWEVGKRDPGSEMLVTIANFFKVSTDYLLGITNDPVRPVNSIEEIPELILIQNAIINMSPAERKKMLNLMKVAFE